MAGEQKALNVLKSNGRITMNRKEVTLDIRKLPLFSALTNFCSNNRNQYFKHLNMKKHLKKHTVEEKAKSVI